MKTRNHHILTIIAIAVILFTSIQSTIAGNPYTRGIGKYPGKVEEYKGPQLFRDSSYHNLALMHTAMASSSESYDLTAQLVTDGIKTTDMPSSIDVSINDSLLSLRDQAKTFDGNIHSYNTLTGEKTLIQYDWRNMSVHTDKLKFNAIAIYHPEKATKGFAIRVLASDDGKQWRQIGKVSSASLPGTATEQKLSSDPNKFEAKLLLPLREVDMTIPLVQGHYRLLRVELEMQGCAYWRIFENLFTDDETGMIPSYQFGSAWVSPRVARFGDKAETQWIYVDLGDKAEVQKIVLHWLQRPQEGKVQVSDDAKNWTDLLNLPAKGSLNEVLDCRGRGRYVRLLMTRVNQSRQYALSELEVWGRNGLTAQKAQVTKFTGNRVELDRNWELCRKGSDHWISATVPGTVLASYLNIGAVPDNTYSNNMRQISESYFNSNFYYRTRFTLGRKLDKQEHIYINLNGINWRSIVKINGKTVGRTDGAFIRGRFDITKMLAKGENEIFIEVVKNEHIGPVKEKNEFSTDLNGGVLGKDNPSFHASIGWDWITSTPGRDMGIWNHVFLSTDKGIHVSDPLLTTTLQLPDTLATLQPTVNLKNETGKKITRELTGWVGDIYFKKTVTLAPYEQKDASFLPQETPVLCNRTMRLWWPNGYGEPYLYDAGFAIDGDTVRYKAGIRQMEYRDLDTDVKLYINGKRFVPLGGNWGFSEINLNYRKREYDVALKYHRDMNMTMVRNWVGQIGDKEFFEACDRYGIMVWQDFWLANPWDGPNPTHEDMFMANADDVIRKIRQHPSIAIYCGRNEGFPPQTLDALLAKSTKALHPQSGYIPSSADKGVSGHGPYRIMPSDTWYYNRQSGKLHSERGIPNVPSFESMSRMLAPEDMWPIGKGWGQHDFTMKGAPDAVTFLERMDTMFGKASNARQFIKWSQWINYDSHRSIYESEHKYRKGLLIWMTHPCWPSAIWQTYDYYFEPTSAYFSIKKACEPLHIQFNPLTKDIELVNIAGGKHTLSATAEYLDISGKVFAKDEIEVNTNDDETQQIMKVRPVASDSIDVWFLRLRLLESNKVVSENTYVESKQENNFKALHTMSHTSVDYTSDFSKNGNEWMGKIVITNNSSVPALMVRLNLKGNDGEQILPVIYSDNYFHLMPSESKTITIKWNNEDSRGCKPVMEVSGFNL
uniref:F5/8 type C domain-containing protein n=1 Tax=Prevotella sp. GTC17259 TaxID=3236795 RepID=A0AB33J3Q8_9BACT